MGRLLRHESNNLLLSLCFVFVCIYGAISFNDSYIFNMVFVTLMILLCMLHSGHSDLVSLFFLLIISRVTVVIFFNIGHVEFLVSSFTFRLVVYSSIGLLAFYLRYQSLSKIIGLLYLITIPAEIYWYMTDYEAPFIGYYFIGIAISMSLKLGLLMRPVIFRSWGNVRSNNLDYNISEVFFLTALVDVLMIIEYLIRHIFGKNILVVYNAYEYLQHTCSMLVVFLILYYAVSHPKNFLIRQNI